MMESFVLHTRIAAAALLALAGCAAGAAQTPEVGVVSGLGTEVYAENFDEGAPWGAGTGGACERRYRDGHFVVTNISQAGTCELNLWLVGPLSPHVRIELTAGFVDGPGSEDFGLKFGYKPLPGAGFHTFTIKGDGVFGIARYDGVANWENLSGWRPDPFVYTGHRRENRLVLEIRGREIRYFANGAQLGQMELEHEPEGYIGLYLNAPGLVARFDEFRVVTLPVATPQ